MLCPAPSRTVINLPPEDAVVPREWGGRENGARLFLEVQSERQKVDGRRGCSTGQKKKKEKAF